MAAALADNRVPRGWPDLNTQISHCFSLGGAWDPGGRRQEGGRAGPRHSSLLDREVCRQLGPWPQSTVSTHGDPTLSSAGPRRTRTLLSGPGERLIKTGEKVEGWAETEKERRKAGAKEMGREKQTESETQREAAHREKAC